MVCIGQISISFFRAGSGGGHCKLPSAVNIPCETKVREGCLYQVQVKRGDMGGWVGGGGGG